jgi:soluble lytic murein transglycosylase-like protein
VSPCRLVAAALAAIVLLGATPAAADELSLPALISRAAAQAGVHPDLLAAIVWVESRAWPWALNVRGYGVYPRTRAEAEGVLARVGDDVDIGYAQVNYRHWGRPLGFSKADLLDPWINLTLGALILRSSMAAEGGWLGVGRYHSATPWRKAWYAATVARVYQTLTRLRAERAAADGAAPAAPAAGTDH